MLLGVAAVIARSGRIADGKASPSAVAKVVMTRANAALLGVRGRKAANHAVSRACLHIPGWTVWPDFCRVRAEAGAEIIDVHLAYGDFPDPMSPTAWLLMRKRRGRYRAELLRAWAEAQQDDVSGYPAKARFINPTTLMIGAIFGGADWDAPLARSFTKFGNRWDCQTIFTPDIQWRPPRRCSGLRWVTASTLQADYAIHTLHLGECQGCDHCVFRVDWTYRKGSIAASPEVELPTAAGLLDRMSDYALHGKHHAFNQRVIPALQAELWKDAHLELLKADGGRAYADGRLLKLAYRNHRQYVVGYAGKLGRKLSQTSPRY